jgi:ATP-dependent Clp protease protease subunit
MRNRLLSLYALNARKGAGIVAEGNTIYLYDFIAQTEEDAQFWGGISAEGFARTLNTMTGDVMVRIDSPGGDVFGGRAIAQSMRDYPGSITCQIDGIAASAASTVAIAGDRVVAAPGAFVMIHRSWSLAIGNCNDLMKTAGVLEKIDGTIADSYAARVGASDNDWLALMDAETWFTAAEALEIGLIDATLPERSAKGAAARAAWNLSAFDHPPITETEGDPVIEPIANTEDDAARRRRLTADMLQRAA